MFNLFKDPGINPSVLSEAEKEPIALKIDGKNHKVFYYQGEYHCNVDTEKRHSHLFAKTPEELLASAHHRGYKKAQFVFEEVVTEADMADGHKIEAWLKKNKIAVTAVGSNGSTVYVEIGNTGHNMDKTWRAAAKSWKTVAHLLQKKFDLPKLEDLTGKE